MIRAQVNMTSGQNSTASAAGVGALPSARSRVGFLVTLAAVGLTLVCACTLPKGYLLSWIGDTLQTALLAAFVILSLQNVLRSHGQVRAYWTMIFLGAAIWFSSQLVWATYEIIFRVAVPDTPFADFLLIAKLVPLTVAAVLEPNKPHDSRFRAFGLLDLSILIFYSLYLFLFFVYAYRQLPAELNLYNSRFNVADSIGNLLFALIVGIACFRERSNWRSLFGLHFFAGAAYGVASSINDVVIDEGRYYTGSLYDVLLIAGMAGFIWMCLAGRPLIPSSDTEVAAEQTPSLPSRRFRFASSHLAMLVTISTPAAGLWLLTTQSHSDSLFAFRLVITLATIFLLTLLLSIKQDLLGASLFGSLQRLSHTYSSIDRFQHHLVQSEKLATLGELVARVANNIGDAMTSIREQSARITSRSSADTRTHLLASKIGQYAQRTDSLAENMQRFAQESPLQLAPVEVKPLLETALHLSRIGKQPNLRVELREEGSSASVLADSSQLLHVFLQIISNAMDALQEAGGDLHISIRVCEPQVCIRFADNGPGIAQPERVFEPFFTTKAVGKGTGLGLSTCYGIIRQHNGDISCGNRLEGGAYFTIFLPAAAPSASSASPPLFLATEDAR